MLKLREARNAYELLGLPRSATADKIRARFGRLARNYRKELAPQELLEEARFRRWTNAYLLLLGPERREYDRRLRQSKGREEPGDLVRGLSGPRRLVLEAEVAFAQRKLNAAVELGKEAAKQAGRSAEVYGLLGDVLREQGRYQESLTMYNYAIQFDPNNARYWELVEEATALREGRALPRRYRRERPTVLNRPIWAWALVFLVLAAAELSALYLRNSWGGPALLGIPVRLVYVASADGFLLGLALAATAILMPFDDELISYQVAGFGVQTTPVGVLVAFPGIVFFWAALLFYGIVALLDEYASLSIVIALLVCGMVTVGFGLLAPRESKLAVYLLGGDFVFFGFLWGWLVGSIRRRVFEH